MLTQLPEAENGQQRGPFSTIPSLKSDEGVSFTLSWSHYRIVTRYLSHSSRYTQVSVPPIYCDIKKGRHPLDASPSCLLDVFTCSSGTPSVRSVKSVSLLERAEAHAARGGNRRQEGREGGYYHLHRYLNDALFHASPPLPFSCRSGHTRHRLRPDRC